MRVTRQVVCAIICTWVAVTGWRLPKRTEAAVVPRRLGTGLPPNGSAGILPQTWVAPVNRAPRVDGKLDEDLWSTARPIVLGKLTSRGKTTPRTEARLIHHGRVLYVGLQLDEPNVRKLKRNVTEDDGPLYGDDSVELFISPFPSQGYVQFIIGASGAVFDRKGYGDPKAFDAGATAAVEVGQTGWTLEVAIPMEPMGVGDDVPARWRANIYRNRQAGWKPAPLKGCPASGDPAAVTPRRERRCLQNWEMNRMKAIVVAVAVLSPCAAATASDEVPLAIACLADNDLLQVLSANQIACERYDSAAEAVRAAEGGTGVLILAADYPNKPTALDPALLELATEKKLRLYIEYPEALPGVQVGRPRSTHVERAVVASDFFGSGLKKLRIVSINGLHYLPVDAERAHIVAARVAGFDTAVYGLPEETAPILFEVPGRNVMVATTKLSHFVTGRYAPQDSWRAIFGAILKWLSPNAKFPPLQWTPTVRATYKRDEPLPDDYEVQAIQRGVDWFSRAKMIVHPSFRKQIAATQRIQSLPADTPVGDGSLGSLEAVISVIHQDGTQSLSSVRRGDCICETAMALAFGGSVFKNKANTATAANLLDFYLLDSMARKKERGDPEHGAYGLIAWGITTPAWYKANYGDDNARQMMATLATAALSGEDRWDEAMMMCLLANLRTTGQYGFRTNRIDIGGLGDWKRYFRGRPINYAPHFEAYLWACYLWAYEQTGYELFLDRAETALKMTMEQYTDGWRWTNGLAQERARIVLPLAWLVRVKDTPENRAMLRKAVDGLIALQDKSGAIREELGLPGRGAYPPPRSNAAYGTNEASLIAENGDPVADLLYTTNFAFLGLHEAAAATGDKDVADAENRLAEFLCRIQIKSDVQPPVDGGWFRAFDFKRWEHWGCNADHGWGAWCIESGWTQGWITSVLAMRQMDTSLWDLTRKSKIERHFDRLRKQMLPDEALASLKPKTVVHTAVGSKIKLANAPSRLYPGKGAPTLVDGLISHVDHGSGAWLGFHGNDLEAVIDLGQTQSVRRIAARFLKSTGVGIYLPEEVGFEASEDGKRYRTVATMKPAAARKEEAGPLVETVKSDKLEARARYVRVVARNVATIPAGHRAAGQKAWLFADEILIDRVPAESGSEERP